MKALTTISQALKTSRYDLFCRDDKPSALSKAIDRLHALPEHVQYEIIALIAKRWAEHSQNKEGRK